MTEHAAEAAHHTGEAVHHGAAGIKGGLGRKLGPMPVGGWLLAVAGGVLVAWYFRRASAATDPTATDPTTATTGWDTADPGGTNAGVGGGVGNTGGGGGTGGGTSAHHTEAYLARQATTNAEWKSHAVLAMAPFGFDAAHVARALDDYLAGHKLNQGETVTLAATESRCGPPPHPPKHQAPPGTPPPHKPSGQHDPTGSGDNGPKPHHHPRDNGTPPTPPTKPHHR